MRRRLFAVLLLIPLAVFAASQFWPKGPPLLAGHNFQDGGYSLVGTFLHGQGHPIQQELGEFYLDDPAVLAKMQSDWYAGMETAFYPCGYHYTIHLVRDGKILERFLVNLETECGTVVIGNNSYRFDTNLLTRYADHYRKPVAEHREFASLDEGNEFLAGLAGNPRLLMIPDPPWHKYDPQLTFYWKQPE